MSLPATMHGLQLQVPGRLGIATLPVPIPGPRDVLVRTLAATICTSDLHDIDHNPFNIALPRVMGHEGAGEVVGLGAEVTGIRLGDTVALHPVVPCRDCPECQRGMGHHCVRMGHLGFDREGCFADYVAHRADRVRVLPAGLDPAVGALLEPVCVCLQAVARAGDLRGKTLLVVGDGPFGVLIARLALRTAARVILLGREPFRLRQVQRAVTMLASDHAATLSALKAEAPAGIDAAILAVGSTEGARLALAALRPRGRLVLFAAPPRDTALDLFSTHVRELEIVGACNDEERLDEALALLADPALDLAGLVTHRLPFDRWPEAFQLARHGHDRALKVAITFPSAS